MFSFFECLVKDYYHYYRIGITTVLSTDHVRSLLRSFDPEHKSKVLWASSYHAGENLPDKKVIDGYKAQSQLMLDTLDKMLKGYIERKESLVIEVNSIHV